MFTHVDSRDTGLICKVIITLEIGDENICFVLVVVEAVRAATHYHTRAWQTLIYGKECYIVIVIYLPFKHKQFHIILFNLYAEMSTVT